MRKQKSKAAYSPCFRVQVTKKVINGVYSMSNIFIDSWLP